MEWFRWYHGTVNDPKFTIVARVSGQPKTVVLAIWSALLEFTSNKEDRGSLEGFDPEDVAAALDLDTEVVVTVCHAMSQKKLIDGKSVTNWKKRQPKREDETSAERKRNQREREKLQAQIAELERKIEEVTQCHAESRNVTLEKRREEKRREEEKAADSNSDVDRKGADEADVEQGAGKEDLGERVPVFQQERMPMSEILDLKRKCLQTLVENSGEAQVLQELCHSFPPEVIREAFKAAAEKGIRRLPWVTARIRGRDSPAKGADAEAVLEQNRQTVRDFCGLGGAA